MQSATRSRTFLRTFPFVDTGRLPLPLLFILFGIAIGSWAGRIPAIREQAGLSHSMLSAVLLCGGLGSVISYPISSRMISKLGARSSIWYTGLALLLALACIGQAASMAQLMLALLAFGVAASCFDVAINAAATALEKSTGKSELSKLHGFWCIGNLTGTLLASMAAQHRIMPAVHLAMIAIPTCALIWLCSQSLDQNSPRQSVEKKAFCLPKGPLALLGLLGFLGSMSEGSIADWSGLFLKERFEVSDSFAPLAMSCFSLMMLATRMAGDRLRQAYSARSLLGAGAAISAAGLLFAVLTPSPYLALLGFACAGAGLALVFPFVFSAAGEQGPMALAGVATMSYSGSLMGPPIIGALAHGLGMQAAVGFIALLSVGIAFVALRAKALK